MKNKVRIFFLVEDMKRREGGRERERKGEIEKEGGREGERASERKRETDSSSRILAKRTIAWRVCMSLMPPSTV